MSLDSTASAPTADASAPLTIDDAVSLLTDEPVEYADAPAEEAQTDQASDDQADVGDDAPDEDDPASEEAPEDDEDAEEPQAAAIQAPEFWSAEEKALFAQAPPDVQMLVAAKTAEAEKRVYSAKEEAAEARKAASGVAEQGEKLDQFLSHAESLFRDRWDGVDFVAWAATDPQAAFQAKLEYDAEQQAISQARSAREAAQTQEHRQFLSVEFGKLKEAGSPLADPQKGKEARTELLTYMTSQGIPEEAFSWASASELTIAHKAMLYDKLQAERARKPIVAAPNPAQGKATATRPTAPPPPRKVVTERRRVEVVTRAMKTGKMDDAVAAVLALGE